MLEYFLVPRNPRAFIAKKQQKITEIFKEQSFATTGISDLLFFYLVKCWFTRKTFVVSLET